MKPELYFPEIYNEDLKSVLRLDEKSNLRGGMLCGATFIEIKKHNVKIKYYEDFFCCQYGLNLINQGIHCYFREDEIYWLQRSHPFLDMRMCSVHHGGIGFPRDILRHVNIGKEKLAKYTKHFLFEYVANLKLKTVNPDNLLLHLKKDEDCREINELINIE